MLNPEQLTLRRQDRELQELRSENKRLEEKLSAIRTEFANLLRVMAKYSGFGQAIELLRQADELESDK